MIPSFDEQHFRGVRRVDERVVILRINAHFHSANFFANGDHGIDEAIQLVFALALSRLDHERASDGEAHGRRMKAVVHQALGNIHIADAAQLLDWAHVNDALMRDEAAVAGVEHREMRSKFLRDVIGIEDCDCGCFA